MGGVPPGVFVLLVAALSALAGALLTWTLMHVTGEGGLPGAKETSQSEEISGDDLLRVTRTKSGPGVFIRGRRFHHLREIKDRETGQETIIAVREVLTFAEGWLPALQDEPQSSAPSHRGAASGTTLSPSPLRQRAPVSTGKRTVDTSASEPLRLIEEINALLQRRLEGRPDLAKLGIRLTRDIHGRPLFYVGQEHYRSADDIRDDEVSAFVRDTIQMWENE